MKQVQCPFNLLNATGMIIFLRIDMYCILELLSLYVLKNSTHLKRTQSKTMFMTTKGLRPKYAINDSIFYLF